MKTLKDLAQEALDVQDACSLVAVSYAFNMALLQLRDALEALDLPCGTDALRGHAITRVWADKIASLADVQALGHENVMTAFQQVGALAKGEEQ